MSAAAPWPQPRPGVAEIEPYVPGRTSAGATPTKHKLSSNETPFGPSPAALQAYRDAASSLDRYPDGSAQLLRRAIAEYHKIDPDRIVCGAGSDEILALLAHTFLSPGDEAILTQHGFLVYKIATLAAGGVPIVVPETNLTADVDSIVGAIGPRTRIVFLANPNNPTGTYLPASEIERLHSRIPDNVLLVLDAAYAEYVRRADYSAGLELATTAENVIMTRTFSKVFGLAGLRIGWSTGPTRVLNALNRVRGPFNVSGPAIAAGAAAMGDLTHLRRAVDHNEFWLPRVSAAIDELGLSVTPSTTNFVLIHFPDTPGTTAANADSHLLNEGIVLRRMEPYGLAGALRMTIGSEQANRNTVQALARFLRRRAPSE